MLYELTIGTLKMKMNRKQQRGATLITWLIVAGFAMLAASAVVKVAPYYVEFNSVKSMMENIAGSPGAKKANLRQIYRLVENHLNVNGLYALERAYVLSKSKSREKRTKNPFTIMKLRKGKNRRVLTVNYDVPQPWIGNLGFLIKFNHSVVLGEPKAKIEIKRKEEDGPRKQKLKLN